MVVKPGYDFSGWASMNDLLCGDGRIIRSGAFAVNDGEEVPIFWNHDHNSMDQVLGHALLENREEGVYAYGYLNDTPNGQLAKQIVKHGDITHMSIWANNLQQSGSNVLKGVIREVSLVAAGANPGAFIESVASHGYPMEDYDPEGIFYTNEPIKFEEAPILSHAEPETPPANDEPKPEEKKEGSEPKKGKTIKEIVDSMTEEQRNVLYALLAEQAQKNKSGKTESDDNTKKGDDDTVKHNIFSDGQEDQTKVLSHSDMEKIFADAKRIGSLREAVQQNIGDGELVHALDLEGMDKATGQQKYGFNDPDMLFPEFKATSVTPEWLSRNMDWVAGVMSSVHRTPFSRIKSHYANITEDDARARGYIKGKQKKEEVFTLLKRTTTPQTIYKLQKLDRDDIIDITDFDIVAWIRAEMRVMLNEEIARAILIGDGRNPVSEDHISEDHIRPVVTDVPLYNTTILVEVAADATPDQIAKATIDAVIRSRKEYKGSGNPVFYTTEDTTTEMLMLEDKIGHKLYKSDAELATTLRVSRIQTVEPMEGHKVKYKEVEYPLIGTIVNLRDYTVGADKGGAVSMFDDFDIDYNQYKYLIETRCSGALTKPFSAITLLLKKTE